MDNELFELAVEAALRIPKKDVIGTKSEHRVHGALKYYFQPNDAFHEIKLEGFICDATDSEQNEVFEIQTRAFDRLKKKLSVLLLSHPVTVIYPVIVKKRIIATYEASGETHVRSSPKKAREADIFAELFKIKNLLIYPDLKIKLAIMTADEYRIFSGTKSERKPFQKPISVERIPTELIEIKTLTYPFSYTSLIPASLSDGFCSADLAKAGGISRSGASYILHLLTELKIVDRVGRNKKGYIYNRANP